MLTNIKLHSNYLSIPGESLAAKCNWCQGPVTGRGPAVEKPWFSGCHEPRLSCRDVKAALSFFSLCDDANTPGRPANNVLDGVSNPVPISSTFCRVNTCFCASCSCLELNLLPETFSSIWKLFSCLRHVHQDIFVWIYDAICCRVVIWHRSRR